MLASMGQDVKLVNTATADLESDIVKQLHDLRQHMENAMAVLKRKHKLKLDITQTDGMYGAISLT